MRPAYIQLTGTTVKVYDVDTEITPFLITIRLASGVTVLGSLEKVADSAQPNSYTAAVTTLTPVWSALPAPVNGVISLSTPYASLQFTPTTGGICTVVQQGTDAG